MDPAVDIESMQDTECSNLIECNVDVERNKVEEKGASGDTVMNIEAQMNETLVTAEQLSLKLSKVNTTDREQLNAAAQQIIEDLNSKRRQDTQLLGDLRKSLETEVNRICNAVEQRMFRLYDKNSGQIQVRIQDLFAHLDRICKIESELQEFKQALQGLYQDMNSSQ